MNLFFVSYSYINVVTTKLVPVIIDTIQNGEKVTSDEHISERRFGERHSNLRGKLKWSCV